MSIYLRDINSITHSIDIDTPSGGLTKGTVQLINAVSGLIGFAFKTTTITATDYENYGEQATMVTKARQCVGSKATGGGSPTFSRGQLVYYDLTAGKITNESTGNAPIGYALENAYESDDEVLFDFDGTLNM